MLIFNSTDRPFVNVRFDAVVEHYLDVYLRTPNLPKQDMARALLVRGNARKEAAERAIMKANQGALIL
jgi:hypothetical protein